MVGSSNAMPACSRGPVLKPISPRTHSIEQVGAIGCRPQPRSVVLRCQPCEASPRSKTMGKVLGCTVAVIIYLSLFFAMHLWKSLLVFGRGKRYSISRAQRSSKPLPSFFRSSSGSVWFRPFPPCLYHGDACRIALCTAAKGPKYLAVSSSWRTILQGLC